MTYMNTFERHGHAQGLLEGIAVSLEIKFGAESLNLLPEIRELQDHKVLQAVLEAIKTVASPDELRRVWAPERRSRKKRQT